jgi:glycosyltransferase involved in cell wall biosynthesis
MLSVVIPTRNRPDLLKSCLERILVNSILPNQIIIVDSSDFNQRISDAYSDTRIIYQTTEIKSAAIQRNIGMELVPEPTKYLAFLDDDVQIESNYFSKLIDTLNSTGAIGVSGLAINPKEKRKASNSWILKDAFSRFFLNNSKKSGVILRSGINIPVRGKSLLPMKSQWLIGCSIWNYNKVKSLRFEKDFFGQSLGEDVIFSLKASEFGSLFVDTSVKIWHLETAIMRPNSEEFIYMWVTNRLRIIQSSKNPKLNLLPYHWANLGKFLQILFVANHEKKSKVKGFFKGYKQILGFTNEH